MSSEQRRRAPSRVGGSAGGSSRFLPARYYLGGLLWVIVVAFPVLTGLVLKALFDRFSEGAAASLSQIAWLLVLFVVLDVIRQAIMWLAIAVWPYWWNSVQTLLASQRVALDPLRARSRGAAAAGVVGRGAQPLPRRRRGPRCS